MTTTIIIVALLMFAAVLASEVTGLAHDRVSLEHGSGDHHCTRCANTVAAQPN